MFKGFDAHKPYFQSVAMAIILCGAAVIAMGIVQLASNLWGAGGYSFPFFKIVGGLVVTSLGYIHLELEMMRIK